MSEPKKYTQDELGLAVSLFIVSFVYPMIAPKKRREWNNSLFRKCRRKLGDFFAWRTIQDLDPEVCESGPRWRGLPKLFGFVIYVAALITLAHGRIVQFLILTLLGSLDFYVASKMSRWWILLLSRFMFFHQGMVIGTTWTVHDQTMALRALVNRQIACISSFNDVDEAFVNSLSFDLIFIFRFGFHNDIAFQATKSFFLGVLPIYLLGMREYYCAKPPYSSTARLLTGRRVLFGAAMFPVLTITFAFMTGSTSRASMGLVESSNFSTEIEFPQNYLSDIVGILYFMVFVVVSILPSEQLDSVLADDRVWAIVRGDDLSDADSLTPSRFMPPINFAMLSLVVGCGMLLQYQAALLALVVSIIFWNRPSILRCSVTVVQVLILIWTECSGRLTGLLEKVLAQSFSITCVGGEDVSETTRNAVLILMTTSRIVLAFEKRTIKQLARDTSLLSTLTLALSTGKEIQPTLAFLALTTSLVFVVCTHARLHAGLILIKEHASHAFLSHAVKQKFCGVGNALEFLLNDDDVAHEHEGHPPSGVQEITRGLKRPRGLGRCLTKSARRLMVNALDECRQGERVCHVLNLVTLLRRSMPLPDDGIEMKSLLNNMFEWTSRGELCVASAVEFHTLSTEDMTKDLKHVMRQKSSTTDGPQRSALSQNSRRRNRSGKDAKNHERSNEDIAQTNKMKRARLFSVDALSDNVDDEMLFRRHALSTFASHDVASSSSTGKRELKRRSSGSRLVSEHSEKRQPIERLKRNASEATNTVSNFPAGFANKPLENTNDGTRRTKPPTIKEDDGLNPSSVATTDCELLQDVEILVNWDVFKLVLCTWSYHAFGLNVYVEIPNPWPIQSTLCWEMEGRLVFERVGGRKGFFENNREACRTLTRAFNGTFLSDSALLVTCPVKLHAPSRDDSSSVSSLSSSTTPVLGFRRLTPLAMPSAPSPAVQSSSRDLGDVIGGIGKPLNELSVALLDDNALVRLNVERMCRQHLGLSPSQITTAGQTKAECEAFAQRLMDNLVDMAILDENLDYDEDHLSGTDIGREARRLGFQGCLVLHSADPPGTHSPGRDQRNKFMDGEDLFDGYLQKTVNRDDFVVGLRLAYSKSVERRMAKTQ